MKSIIAVLTSAARSSWVICPQPGGMLGPQSCGTNFASSVKCARPCREFYDLIAIAGDEAPARSPVVRRTARAIPNFGRYCDTS
jgi:hypothetical protein